MLYTHSLYHKEKAVVFVLLCFFQLQIFSVSCYVIGEQAKISKRSRKLIDYDIARHSFDAMTAKQVDQVKLSKVGYFFLPVQP